MTDAKAYLLQVELLDARVNTRLEELQRLNALRFQITSAIKPISVSSTKRHDKMEALQAKIIDLDNEINDDIDALIDKRHEIGMLLDRLQDPKHTEMLRKRYCEGKPLTQVAMEMHYAYRSACYIHGRALQAVDKLLKESKT